MPPSVHSSAACQPVSASASLAGGPVISASAAALPQDNGCLDSHEILRGQKTVEIRHNGSTYRLQATRLGKLILTK
ncbi:MAG: hemin uptake protein HemP [Polaromonas sp.]